LAAGLRTDRLGELQRSTDPVTAIRGRGWRTNNKYRRNFQWLTWKRRERVGNRERDEREGRGEGIGGEGWDGEATVGKAKGALDFDICPWAQSC